MSKHNTRILVLQIILVVLFLAVGNWHRSLTATETTYPADSLIRLHVIANSDCDADQTLKIKVRDAIIQAVAPQLLETQDINSARAIAAANLDQIQAIATDEVQAAGKDYSVAVKLDHFSFPTKHYGPFVLPAGTYESVQVVLGTGGGSNWWCVLFPPLCFVDMPKAVTVTAPDNILYPASEDMLVASEQTSATDLPGPEIGTAIVPSKEGEVKVAFRFRLLDLFHSLSGRDEVSPHK